MKALIKKSAALKAKSKAEHTRELVLALLEWDESQYGTFVMDKAWEYLKRQCGADAYGIDKLMQCGIFWKWWLNHWAQRDSEFLACWADCDTEEEVTDEYVLLHSAVNLHVRPNKTIMEASYAVMIGAVVDGKEPVKW